MYFRWKSGFSGKYNLIFSATLAHLLCRPCGGEVEWRISHSVFTGSNLWSDFPSKSLTKPLAEKDKLTNKHSYIFLCSVADLIEFHWFQKVQHANIYL